MLLANKFYRGKRPISIAAQTAQQEATGMPVPSEDDNTGNAKGLER